FLSRADHEDVCSNSTFHLDKWHDQFVGGLEREFGIRKRVQLKPTAVPDVHAFDERPAESGASSAVSGPRTAFEKRRRQQIIADLLEPSAQDQNLSQDTVDIEVVAELKNSVGTQTKSSGRHREEELSDTDSDDLETEEIHLPDESVPPQEERKYLVFHSALLQLFSLCLLCGSGKQKLRLETIGSFLSITQICTLCKHVRTWSSQPFIRNTPAGNLLISAAVLFAGAIPQQALNVFAYFRLHCISARTFFRHQRMILHLAIKNVWSRKQAGMFAALHGGGQALILGGDGRADSSGHSAKYGSYTLMDLRTNKILTLQLVQSNEVGSSNAMEKEGLARAIDFIRRNCTLQIGKIVTDRHIQIAKWIRENLPETCHLYDIWHIAKGVSEKLRRIFQNFNIATNFKPHSTLRQRLVHPKDRPHKGTKANVIYRLKCEEPNCNNTYIGETSRPLKVRYKEHCRPSANGYSSAIFHHQQHNQGHSFKLESTDILDRETRWWERDVKEAIYERMYNPTLNREGGLRVDLSGTWDLALPAPRTDNT
ncbi:hypothetical protein Bbelb_363850, partial [Branchiostoma belcheri]